MPNASLSVAAKAFNDRNFRFRSEHAVKCKWRYLREHHSGAGKSHTPLLFIMLNARQAMATILCQYHLISPSLFSLASPTVYVGQYSMFCGLR